MKIEFSFLIQLLGYEFSVTFDEYNKFKGKPYIFRIKETNDIASKYYGHRWAWIYNIYLFEFSIMRLYENKTKLP